MEPNEKDIDEILKAYFVGPPEDEVKAAQLRVLANLRAKYNDLKEQCAIIKALRKVTLEPLHSDDLPVLHAVSLPNLKGRAAEIARYVNSWFYKEFPGEAVEAALDRLERQGLISAQDREARVFAITAEGQAILERGRALAKEFVTKAAHD